VRRLVIVGGLVLLAACAGPRPLTGTDRIDNVPMYGQPQIPRPETHRKADEEFISQAAAKFGGREQASKVWAAQAERFMAQGNHDFAMRRYNQSWLLNPNHYAPYWGFGRVMLERDNTYAERLRKTYTPFQGWAGTTVKSEEVGQFRALIQSVLEQMKARRTEIEALYEEAGARIAKMQTELG